ncbi:protein PLASTID MOVEMENT IMPAIRED 1-RELATED 1-like [Coffea eugenioides]|uniref:protein PLASTID MOVEMENT IMPAIRED 1-RELATED 1-like n=1 Tax=Coffea eugenioides TaxID=49369 RepID=UPI000F604D64|nr:protein PLASTID MOVEMENT IMPAIRED 1-RELATED 1-like [Coffea eugenioides]
MVISKDDTVMSNDEGLSSGQLLRDIGEISQALYLHKDPSKSVHLQSKHQSIFGTKASVRDVFQKEKKSSIWGWKPLKALTHIRSHRFNCFFFLHVHSVEGLPSNFNDLILCVNWKRKNEVFKTHPVRVFEGIAKFEETLMHQCSVYVSRNGPQNSAKYEPKLFLLQASIIGAPTLDIGKHWVDLARLLPLTVEELEEEKRTSGKWTTSFKLKGKAKGAILNVSFGFSILGDNPFDPRHFLTVSDMPKDSGQTPIAISSDCDQSSSNIALRRSGSVPRKSYNGHQHVSSQSLDMKYLSEVFPNQNSELARSINFLYQKLDEGKFGNLKEVDGFHENLVPFNSKSASSGNGFDDSDFIVIDQGVELSVKDDLKLDHNSTECFNKPVIETIDVAEIFQEDMTDFSAKGEPNSNHLLDCSNSCESAIQSKCEENNVYGKESTVEESPMVSCKFIASESAEFDMSSNISKCIEEETYMDAESSCGASKLVRSLSLDDVTESVANEFLDMLGFGHNPRDMTSDGEPESPRGHLLKQFEMEFCAFGNPILDLDVASERIEVSGVARTGSGRVACSDDFDLSQVIQEAEKEYNRVTQSLRSRRNAKMLENLETETLMQRWGLNDKVFQNSPRITSDGFGSPVYFPPEEPSKLPALAEGLGPTIQTKSGGLLRSMSSSLFRRAKNSAKLIMQVSNAVVLPAVMGSNVVEILQCWASGGAEDMFAKANELMPLEDITGRTMEQVIQETEHSSEVIKRFDQSAPLNDFRVKDHSFVLEKNDEGSLFGQNAPNLGSKTEKVYSDYVSLEDLVPLAVANFEALSIEGLRIQCGWSDAEAPSCIRPQFTENWTSVGQNVKLGGVMGSLGPTPLQLLDVKREDGIAELIKFSVSLNEWIRLDAVDIDYENEVDGEMLKILAAHDADLFDLGGLQMTRNGQRVKLSGSNSHLFGNNFTLALRLQLRDPFRDFEMVGSSMLALAQVERICIPVHDEMHNTNIETDLSNKKDDLNEEFVMEGTSAEENHKCINAAPFISRFKISGVHVAGFNVEPNGRGMLINPRQLQSGSRWLLSSGMNRTSKCPFSKSNAITKPSSQLLKKRTCDTLWSISSEVQSAAARWKHFAGLNIHVRNPDIAFPS